VYRHELSEAAEADLLRLPYDVLDDFVTALAHACTDPWNFQRREDEPLDRHFAHRSVKFGGGRGTLWFLIRDDQGLLWVTAVEWAP
jgi:hypothetical protein